jgi:hypothetical protein
MEVSGARERETGIADFVELTESCSAPYIATVATVATVARRRTLGLTTRRQPRSEVRPPKLGVGPAEPGPTSLEAARGEGGGLFTPG